MKLVLLPLLVLALLVVIVGINAAILLVAWNLVMPAIFGLSALTFWQAVGLWFLLATVAGLLRAASGVRSNG